jgi:cobalt-zinc-cadmium efflux system membrane fusion protein
MPSMPTLSRKARLSGAGRAVRACARERLQRSTLLALVLGLAMLHWTLAQGAPQTPTPPPAQPPRTEQTLTISPAQAASLGIVTARPLPGRTGQLQGLPAVVAVPNEQQRVVSAPLAGLLEQVLVASQQTVRRGQLLGRLLSSELADIQHTYLQAVTQLELARTQLDRDEQLLAEGIIAFSRLETTRARWIEVSADHAERHQTLRVAGMSEAAIASLKSGRRVGSTIDLVSPIDGVVLEQLATIGQRVEGSSGLWRIARLDPLWLEIQMPVARLTEVREGAIVEVPAADAQARVIAIGRNINPTSQTVMVRAVTTRGVRALRPGQSLEVAMAAPSRADQWSLPVTALARSGETASVYVKTARGFVRRPVRILNEGSEQAMVSGPLQGTDEIAVRGVAALKAVSAEQDAR